jgi:hypothetical protein
MNICNNSETSYYQNAYPTSVSFNVYMVFVSIFSFPFPRWPVDVSNWKYGRNEEQPAPINQCVRKVCFRLLFVIYIYTEACYSYKCSFISFWSGFSWLQKRELLENNFLYETTVSISFIPISFLCKPTSLKILAEFLSSVYICKPWTDFILVHNNPAT